MLLKQSLQLLYSARCCCLARLFLSAFPTLIGDSFVSAYYCTDLESKDRLSFFPLRFLVARLLLELNVNPNAPIQQERLHLLLLRSSSAGHWGPCSTGGKVVDDRARAKLKIS